MRVWGGELGFVGAAVRALERAVQGEEDVGVLFWGSGGGVGDFELDGWGWVDGAAVAFAEAAGAGGDGLLADVEGVG